MLKVLVLLSILSYAISASSLFYVENKVVTEYVQFYLAIAYSPFFVVFAWAVYLASFLFRSPKEQLKSCLIAFSVNAVVFFGWLIVLIIHFSIFMPHA